MEHLKLCYRCHNFDFYRGHCGLKDLANVDPDRVDACEHYSGAPDQTENTGTIKYSLCISCQHLDQRRNKCAIGRHFDGEIDVTRTESCGQYAALDTPDQTAKADAGKLQLTLVPTQIIRDIAAVRMYGNKKYGSSDNWKSVSPQRFRDAFFRHWLAYIDDPKSIDAESGLPHLWHAACNMAFLCEMEVTESEGEA